MIKHCENCGKEFYSFNGTKYCSECRDEARRKRQRERYRRKCIERLEREANHD